MKKLLLIPALLIGSLSMAADYNYEVTPVIGYNIAEGNLGLDNYAAYGAELQYNGFDSIIKPELSVIYSKADFKDSNLDSDVWRTALNGVYEYDEYDSFTPLAKAGIGYENMADSASNPLENTNSAFLDLGVGAKIPVTDMIALKLEAIYMLKYNDARYDSNLLVLAGLNIAFGEKAQKAAPVVAPVAAIIDGDDDKDGVLNSKDNCLYTEAGAKVDVLGCALPVVNHDTDNDGVLNADDICPNTPAGQEVNSDGCPSITNLNINFENNSAVITKESEARMQKYADFLIKNSNYSAKIVGHTDSKGSATYNQKLSEKRAQAVEADLIARGTNAKQLTSLGKGETNPIADNATAEGRAQNRRIEAELTRN